MGLYVTHDCWDGAYSAFNRWRDVCCQVAGYGSLRDYFSFGGSKSWPAGDALVLLLDHSDCDGELRWQDCSAIADRLESLLPALKVAGDGGGHIGSYHQAAQRWIKGLRLAADGKTDVEFR